VKGRVRLGSAGAVAVDAELVVGAGAGVADGAELDGELVVVGAGADVLWAGVVFGLASGSMYCWSPAEVVVPP
jgi:hypothetical protein